MRAPMDKPNFILINCDDLGYGDLGCYGSGKNDTPALDQMAAEGTRLTDFYMASPVCSPSRGAMMTGCYPKRIGFATFDNGAWVLFPGHHTGLNPEERTVAGLLKEAGYATAIVGKWHCGDQPEFLPTNHGFDSYFGIPFSNDMGRQQPDPDRRPPLPLVRDTEVIQEQPDQAALTERYVEECVRFIRSHRDEPFFLYLAHMHVHLPIYTPQSFLEASRNGRYGAAVSAVDWSVAVLLDELQRQGIDENTLVVFTSDNGSRARNEGGSNGPLNGTKGTTWDGGQRVPGIFRWPGVLPAGRESSAVATSMDILPTFAAMAGVETPSDRIIDGHDIGPLLRGETEESPCEAFFYYFKENLAAVRCGRWKLHVSRRDEIVEELYDLENDIGETTNVAAAHPEIVAQLMGYIAAARDDLGDALVGAEGANCRPAGWVEDARPLTAYDPEHPYIIAEYDLADRG